MTHTPQNTETDDLFNSLINYQDSCDESPEDKPSSPAKLMSVTRVTFLEPNVDVLHNFSSNLNKKALMKLNQDKIEDIRLQQIPFSQNGELHKKTYKLKIIEQPQQCRTSGLTGKDRRPIDPAPIIKLTILDEKNVPERSNPDVIFYILHVSIWSADNSHQYDLVEGCDSESVMLLMGTLVSSALLLKDLNNNPGIFFSFPDLSIRIANNYRLKFSLLDLRRNEVLVSIFSDPFTVYSAKMYPGMKESSDISRHLAKQGLRVTIRNNSHCKR